jgi:hypothetical protein
MVEGLHVIGKKATSTDERIFHVGDSGRCVQIQSQKP